MDVLDLPCPVCRARRGERCAGGTTCVERRILAGRQPAERERRSYDVEPGPVPAIYDEPGSPNPSEIAGRVGHWLDDRTRATGLAGIEQARAALARHRRHDDRLPPRDESA